MYNNNSFTNPDRPYQGQQSYLELVHSQDQQRKQKQMQRLDFFDEIAIGSHGSISGQPPRRQQIPYTHVQQSTQLFNPLLPFPTSTLNTFLQHHSSYASSSTMAMLAHDQLALGPDPMATTTFNKYKHDAFSTKLKPREACQACRARKKKCSGERPACAYCVKKAKKTGMKCACRYIDVDIPPASSSAAVSAASASLDLDGGNAVDLSSMPVAATDTALGGSSSSSGAGVAKSKARMSRIRSKSLSYLNCKGSTLATDLDMDTLEMINNKPMFNHIYLLQRAAAAAQWQDQGLGLGPSLDLGAVKGFHHIDHTCVHVEKEYDPIKEQVEIDSLMAFNRSVRVPAPLPID